MRFEVGDIVRAELEFSEYVSFGSPIGRIVYYDTTDLIGHELTTRTCLVSWFGALPDLVFEDHLELYDKAL